MLATFDLWGCDLGVTGGAERGTKRVESRQNGMTLGGGGGWIQPVDRILTPIPGPDGPNLAAQICVSNFTAADP